jgi:hypothetical protein
MLIKINKLNMKRILKNKKTNLVGLVILVLLVLYYTKLIDTEQFLTSTAFLVSIGLFATKDDEKEIDRSTISADAPDDIAGGGLKPNPK